jgi:hypothetical protein
MISVRLCSQACCINKARLTINSNEPDTLVKGDKHYFFES